MKLNPNNLEIRPLLGDVPNLTFESLWPSELSRMDSKVQSLLEGAGVPAVLQDVARSNWQALQLIVYNKATVIGDLLSAELPQIASLRKVGSGATELLGMFATVDWHGLRDNPSQAIRALVEVGAKMAINTLTAVPMADRLVDIFLNFGHRLVQMIEAAKRREPLLLMPWSTYKRDSDQDLTNKIVIGLYSKQVDQTPLFRPPWTPGSPWALGFAGNEDGFGRMVWAPWVNGEIPWSGDSVGCIPGTMRIFGQVQMQRVVSGVVHPGLPAPVAPLKRITAAGAEMPWPPSVINVGDYYPSAATTCGTMWNMSSKPGSPDMYKIHVQTLLDEWAAAFQALEESFADAWIPGGANLVLGTAMTPWVAYRPHPDAEWILGPPWRVPSYASWVRPGIYNGIAPGVPGFVTESLWIEEDLAHSQKRDQSGGLMFPGWPYGKEPKQHPCSQAGACSSTLGATATVKGVTHPASWKTVNGPAPKGYRKMPWPTPEMRAAQYASPWTAIIRPALERLKAQQETSLKATIVSAYVRPVDLPGLPRYGAFRDPGLRQLCLDVREQLLKHPIRFRIHLRDAEAIDPAFAERLRVEGGLTGTPADFPKSLGLSGGPVDGAPPPPPGEAPQGGVPFGRELASSTGGSGSAALALAGVAAGFGLVRLLRGRR